MCRFQMQKKADKQSVTYNLKTSVHAFAWVSDPFPFSILSSSRFIRTF
jgi:hypothetical protein